MHRHLAGERATVVVPWTSSGQFRSGPRPDRCGAPYPTSEMRTPSLSWDQGHQVGGGGDPSLSRLIPPPPGRGGRQAGGRYRSRGDGHAADPNRAGDRTTRSRRVDRVWTAGWGLSSSSPTLGRDCPTGVKSYGRSQMTNPSQCTRPTWIGRAAVNHPGTDSVPAAMSLGTPPCPDAYHWTVTRQKSIGRPAGDPITTTLPR